MAHNPQLPPEHSTIETLIYDADGNIVARSTVDAWEFVQPDGTWCSIKRSGNFQLADGSIFNAGMMVGNKVMLCVCDLCRHPPLRMFRRERPNHGLIMRHNAVVCAHCRGTFCARHTVAGAYGRRLCLRCRRRQSLLSAIKAIFCTRG